MNTQAQRKARKAHLQALKQIHYSDPAYDLTKHIPKNTPWVDISGNGDYIRNPHHSVALN